MGVAREAVVGVVVTRVVARVVTRALARVVSVAWVRVVVVITNPLMDLDIQPPGTYPYLEYEFVPATPATAVCYPNQ